MKILTLNKLKQYYDLHHIEDKLIEETVELHEIHETTVKVLDILVGDTDREALKEQLKNLTLENWNYLRIHHFLLPVFHIVYFEGNTCLYSQGVNVFANHMAEAIDMFESQTGLEPYICTRKK
jgi:predicted nucleotidyltransferase component of viral defense system